jgi:hypothetical protein
MEVKKNEKLKELGINQYEVGDIVITIRMKNLFHVRFHDGKSGEYMPKTHLYEEIVESLEKGMIPNHIYEDIISNSNVSDC